jgi:abequosyltransferase
MGVDRDMATAVELARGEFCWLMSSDDLVKSGAISKMLHEISSGDDIYLCDVTLCDYSMRPIRNKIFLSSSRDTNQFDLADRGQLLRYLKLATSNNALFCYMSSIVFRRASWINIGYNNRFSGTGYAHVFTLLSFIKTRCLIKYIPFPLVLNRSGNDGFSSQGIEKRYLLDFDGYLLLANQLFSDDHQVRRAFLQVMTREHPWYRLVKLRSEIRSPERWDEVCVKLLEFGYGRNQVLLFSMLGRARIIVRAAVYLNMRFSNSIFLRWLRERA